MNLKYKDTKKQAFNNGIKDGFPIALGYFAVSFSLGILGKEAGFLPHQGFINSILNHASAGEYIVYTLFAAGATYVEIAVMTLVANARYLLMSTALSQRIHPDTSMIHRILVGFGVTDEIFAISIRQPGYLNPFYSYGAVAIALPSWAMGTALGIMVGNILPDRLISAFSVALYGMFLACIMPEARRHKLVGVLIIISFVLSYIANEAAIFAKVSSGTKTIILTVVIASVAAIIFPHPEVEDDD
jgi:predicted branched-subunit amino acid permease